MIGSQPPKLAESTREERLGFVRREFPCLSDCDLCGTCAQFHGTEPRYAFADYIEGKAEFLEVAQRYRR